MVGTGMVGTAKSIILSMCPLVSAASALVSAPYMYLVALSLLCELSMARPTIISWPWLSACVLLVIPMARETSGWLIRPTCSSARSRPLFTCGRCRGVQLGELLLCSVQQ